MRGGRENRLSLQSNAGIHPSMSRRVTLITASLLAALLGAGGLVLAQVNQRGPASQKTRDQQAAANTRRVPSSRRRAR